MSVNEFLHAIKIWFTRESKRHSNSHADYPMEHVVHKISPYAIARIRHVWREGQNNNYDFIKKTEFSYAFKSGCSRRCLDQVDVLKLCEDCSRVTSKSTFDEQLRNFQLLHEIYLLKSDWVCSCPFSWNVACASTWFHSTLTFLDRQFHHNVTQLFFAVEKSVVNQKRCHQHWTWMQLRKSLPLMKILMMIRNMPRFAVLRCELTCWGQ